MSGQETIDAYNPKPSAGPVGYCGMTFEESGAVSRSSIIYHAEPETPKRPLSVAIRKLTEIGTARH